MPALLIDLDGVLYETDKPLPGAAATIQWLRERDVPHLFLTNTTSRPRAAIVEKLAGMQRDAFRERPDRKRLSTAAQAWRLPAISLHSNAGQRRHR